ncbi:MAG: carboxypeptidase-like regulatory domain-containing protein [Planctomycetota bacterium]|nr:carboxypeptidase-like regulatory domain-containing protein [Planctomycetota bacterium]
MFNLVVVVVSYRSTHAGLLFLKKERRLLRRRGGRDFWNTLGLFDGTRGGNMSKSGRGGVLSRGLPIAVLVVALLVAGLFVSGIFEGEEGGVQAIKPKGSSLEVVQELGTVRLPVSEVVPSQAGEGQSRELVAPRRSSTSCLVVDTAGLPITGASVSWCPISVYRPSLSYPGSDWEFVSEATTFLTSDVDGYVELPSNSESVPGALWVTASGFEATNAVVQGKGRRALLFEDGRVQVTLTAAVDATVSVLGLEDGQVAQVVQRVGASGAPGGETEALYALFVRERTVSSDPIAHFSAAGYAFSYGAHTLDRSSGDLLHTGGGAVELAIQQAVAIRCTFRGKAPFGSNPKITVYGLVEGRLAVNRASRVLPDELAAETLLVAWMEDESIRLQFEGLGLLTQQVTLLDVRPGVPLEVTFDVLPGIRCDVYVQDNEGHPVEGASVLPSWSNDSDEFCLGTAFDTTDSKGHVVVANLPAELFTLWVTHEDYGNSSSGPYLTAAMDRSEITVSMTKPGELRGRVTFQGEPVENFHIASWTGGSQMLGLVSEDFIQSTDGSFLMSTAPVGEVYVLASAANFGQSRVVQVTVSLVDGGDVELELSEPVLGRGTIVDEVTGEPVSGAEVLGWTSMATTPIETIGPVVRTGSDGSFELQGFAPGAVSASVYAEGFVDAAITAVAEVGGFADFGTIRLMPATPLTVRFVDPGVADWSSYMVSADGVGNLEPQGLSADGVVVLPGARRGEYRFVLTNPSGLRRWERFLVWGVGPWEKTIDFGSSNQYQVHFTGAGDLLEQGARIYVSSNGTFRSGKEWSGLVGAGASEVAVTAFGGEEHLVRVFGQQFRQLGSLMIPNEAPSGTVFEMDLSKPKTGRVQLISGSGQGMEGMELSFRSAQNPNCHVASATTDAKGIAILECLDEWEGQLVIQDQARLGMFGLPVALPKDGSVLVVEWDVVSDLSLRVHDNGVPLEGLDVWLHTPDGVISIDLMNVNSEGYAAHQGLAPGKYLLQPGAPWVWPGDIEVRVTADGFMPSDVEFRRLGGLEFIVTTAAGIPVEGAKFTLGHLELSRDLQGWLTDGLVTGAESLRSGKDGRLALARIPRGTITWSLASGESGKVQILPEGVARVKIVVNRSE